MKFSKAPHCPLCGGVMVKRTGKNGPFFGCTAWPKCPDDLAQDHLQAMEQEDMDLYDAMTSGVCFGDQD